MTVPATPDAEVYAEALLCLAQAGGRQREVESALRAVLDGVEHNPDTKRFLRSPMVRGEGKREALGRLLGDSAPALLLDFLGILLDNGHLHALPAIAAAFFVKASERRGGTAGELVTAAPMPAATLRAVSEAAAALLGRPVDLHPRLDPSLIGGAIVRVGDFVLDNTIDRRIEDMRAHLLQENVPPASP
jgi:F-type H+-transporting ATPase subunit delta